MEKLSLLVLFVEGIFSFFSPCVLPILPVYIGILSNSNSDKDKKFVKTALFRNTLFFVLGISTTFFILGSSIKALGLFFNANKDLITTVGGVIIIFMGLFYMGVIKSTFLSREKRFNVNTNKQMNVFSSFLLGFTFSFGWTPCIGPMLASVMIMSSSASGAASMLLVAVYTLGFILPFVAVSLFYKKLIASLGKVKKHMTKIKIAGGVILILSGALMVYSGFEGTVKHFNEKFEGTTVIEAPITNNSTNDNSASANNHSQEEQSQDNGAGKKIPAIDFTLYDQYGKKHTLSEYKGKTVFLNFWATWCPPCRAEMPYINELYKEYGDNQKDVIILGIASPDIGQEKDVEGIKKFLKDMNMTFPTGMDNGGSQAYQYGIYAFPSTLIIDKEGYVVKYVPGAMDKQTMQELIESAK